MPIGGSVGPQGIVAVHEPRLVRTGRRGMRLTATHRLSERAKGFLMRFLDPCGEYQVTEDNSKVPDGALPNSALIGLREFEVIRSPWGDGTVGSDTVFGRLWNLWIISLPWFRHPALLISNDGAAELTDGELVSVVNELNLLDNQDQPIYPTWHDTELGIKCSYLRWSMLENLPTPVNGQSNLLSQYRITADGITVYHNAPDLVNQGMIVGAQWNMDVGEIPAAQTRDEDGLVSVAGYAFAQKVANTSRVFLLAHFPFINTTQAAVPNPIVLSSNVGEVGTADIVFTTPDYSTITVQGVTLQPNTSYLLRFTATTISGPGYEIVPTIRASDAESTIVVTFAAMTMTYAQAADISSPMVWRVPSIEEAAEPVKGVRMPTLNSQAMVQSTPKAVVLTMKEDNGAYMVKRVAQPVFNMQEANTYGPMRWRYDGAGIPSDQPGGLRDTHDLNFNIGVMAILGIPYAAAPSLKFIRDVEVVAAEKSTWATFMHGNGERDEVVIGIARTIMDAHPFMYPESANSMGGLMGALQGIVSKIPIIGNVLPAVQALLGSTAPASSHGMTQNRLGSLNVDEIGKLIRNVVQQLNL